MNAKDNIIVNHAGRGFCRIAQFINQGVLVSGRTATVQFEILGGFESFQCDLDREGFIPCEILRELLCIISIHRLLPALLNQCKITQCLCFLS